MVKARIFVIMEHRQGHIPQAAHEALSFALDLGARQDLGVMAMIPGNRVETPARELARTAGVDVTGVKGEHLEPYNGEVWKGAVAEVLEDEDPLYICMSHTATGFDLAPRLAYFLKASCITSVVGVRITGDKVSFIRPMFNNKLHGEITPAMKKTVLTVLPGSGPDSLSGPASKGHVRIVRAGHAPSLSKTLKLKASQKTGLNLGDADLIVSAGRGLGGPENLHLLEELVKAFPGAALASSKALCDQGWLPYKHQVGVTGQTVSPRLYLACGISGAPQHIGGMRGSQTIVAINTNPEASIFNVSDYCVVEDLETFIPVLLKELKGHSGYR
ncbi:MAG TPA: electron transfer flavoprotein subunit alpha/FixB family protein [Deltaproteobacteria bacterium]|nr:electron transfer flavoprotein subunit alpha/FixB family protein [Deltaproteobacteria bacterium]